MRWRWNAPSCESRHYVNRAWKPERCGSSGARKSRSFALRADALVRPGTIKTKSTHRGGTADREPDMRLLVACRRTTRQHSPARSRSEPSARWGRHARPTPESMVPAAGSFGIETPGATLPTPSPNLLSCLAQPGQFGLQFTRKFRAFQTLRQEKCLQIVALHMLGSISVTIFPVFARFNEFFYDVKRTVLCSMMTSAVFDAIRLRG